MTEAPGAGIRIEPATAADAEAILAIFVPARLAALQFLTGPEDTPAVRRWIREVIAPRPGTFIALQAGQAVGFLSLQGDYIDQLYLAPPFQARGIGTVLLDQAKRLSPGSLHLHTFQCNTRARRFYEARGFVIVSQGDGSANQEGQPDLCYRWTPASQPGQPPPG
jgi:GNAT superfamily N-acetyltransferase